MLWYKEWANSDANPKIVAAGFWGATIFRALCRTSAEFDLNGRIPPSYASDTYISHRLQLGAECDPFESGATDATVVQRGIVAAVASGLLVRDGSDLLIDGWGDRQTIGAGSGKTSTERSQALRSRRKADATECNGAPLHATRCNVEKRREDQRRELPLKGSGSGEASGLWELFAATRASLSVLGPDGFTDMATPRPDEACPESWPAWAEAALAEVGVDAVPRLLCAYKAFLRDKTFAAKTPPWATQVFMHPNVWRGRVPEARAA